MKKMYANLCLLSLLVLFSREVSGQQLQLLSEKFATSVHEKYPAWRLSRKEMKSASTFYVWETEKQPQAVFVSIYPTESEQTAAERLRRGMMIMQIPPKSELKNLGDEAFLYQSNGSEACTIVFRKSGFFIRIAAPSLAIGRDFANTLLELIASK
jgi:hypothetical protein